MSASLKDRTIVMSGGSRGIGLAILLAAAKAGANAVLLAKTDQPDPRLPGTVHTAVEEIEAAGGRAVAVVGDVREEDDVARAVSTAVEHFGGVDVVVNNASALNLAGTLDLTPKRYDLMQQINAKGTFQLTRAALPQLFESEDAQIVTLGPPINLAARVAREVPVLRALQVRHDAADARVRRGVRRPRGARQLPVAADDDLHGRRREPPRR